MPWIPAPRVGARSRRALLALAAAGALSCALAACTSPTPAPSPDPSPTATPSDSTAPIFASDEEALAAAVAAYERYRSVSSLITSEGGAAPERIRSVVTDAYAPTLIAEFEAYRVNGIRTSGESTIDSPRLAEAAANSSGDTVVAMYACGDISQVRLLDAAGSDLTDPNRDVRTPLIITFALEPSDAQPRVDGIDVWSGDDFC